MRGNNTQHWYECDCGEKANIENHTLEWKRKAGVLGDRVSITGDIAWEEGHYQACSVYNYRTAYQHHEGAYRESSINAREIHTIICDICGENTVESHYYVVLYDDTHHWKTCPCGYCFDKDKDVVPQTFAVPETLAGNENVVYAAVHKTANGNEIGTVTISKDGKTLTATYTVSSFSPFTIYAFSGEKCTCFPNLF